MSLASLRLQHLADSAFPIGAASHSFGLETLAAEGVLTAQSLQSFLRDFLWETGQAEAMFARLAYGCALHQGTAIWVAQWLAVNSAIAAWKAPHESREASATLGRRFLQTVAHLEATPCLLQAQTAAQQATVDTHYCAAFGLVGGALQLGEDATTLAYLQQSLMGLVSACLRLLPIGQGRASEILWEIKPLVVEVMTASQLDQSAESPPDLAYYLDRLTTFTPMLDLASMRHATLPTRLFIS